MMYAHKRNARLGILVWSCVSLATVVGGCQGQNVKSDAVGTVPFVDWATLKTLDARTSDLITFPSHIGVKLINGHELVGGEYDGRASCTYGRCKLHPGRHTVVLSYAWSQILDADSGSLVARAIPSCRLQIEMAFPYSDRPIPNDKCAIHVLAGEDIRTRDVQFKLESVGPNWYQLRDRKAYTFIVEPGSHTIDASIIGHTEFSKKPLIATRIVPCDAGAAVYNLVDVEGFWSPKLAISNLPFDEAEDVALRVVPGS
jgi:hypothetical protein